MMSVHDQGKAAGPKRPARVQGTVVVTSHAIPRIIYAITLVFVLMLVGAATVIVIGTREVIGQNWNIIPTATIDFNTNNAIGPGTSADYEIRKSNARALRQKQTMTVYIQAFTSAQPDRGPAMINEPMMAVVLLVILAIQSMLTISLHCAELLVTLIRDESVWRYANSQHGLDAKRYNSVLQPFRSWQNIALLAFKPVIHWMFGQAVSVDYAKGLLLRVPHIVYLTVLWCLFMALVLQMSFGTRPKGPLPATYGHFQTLADLIDELSPKMYWGDKGRISDIDGERHAGTNTAPLPEVHMDALYS